MARFAFPRWANTIRPLLAIGLAVGPVYLVGLVAFGASPWATDVGYRPKQPIDFSHKIHAGKLGMDCRYCHTTVEETGFAAVPPSETCMNCHVRIHPTSPKLTLLREKHAAGEPIEWVKVHDLADFVYFNHSAHVRRGVGCVSCHGRIDTMDVVTQVKPLSMSWCLECHRNPDPNLRPLDKITDMVYDPKAAGYSAKDHRAKYDINPSTDCSTCHR